MKKELKETKMGKIWVNKMSEKDFNKRFGKKWGKKQIGLGECFVDSLSKGTQKRQKNLKLAIIWAWVLLVSVILTFLVVGLIVDKKVGNHQTKENKVVGFGYLLKENATISFYSELDSCHTGKSCLMYNGLKAERGFIACPRYVPIGSKILIKGLVPNFYECGDRTAKYVDGRFDVFLGYGEEAYKEAISRGIEYHNVYYIVE